MTPEYEAYGVSQMPLLNTEDVANVVAFAIASPAHVQVFFLISIQQNLNYFYVGYGTHCPSYRRNILIALPIHQKVIFVML